MVSLIDVFNRLNDKEHKAANQTNAEIPDDTFIISLLGFGHRNRGRIARIKKDYRVESSSLPIKVMTRRMKLREVVVTHDSEATKHHRKEKYLGCEEEPHAKLRGSVCREAIHVMNMGWLSWRYVVIKYRCVTHNILVD